MLHQQLVYISQQVLGLLVEQGLGHLLREQSLEECLDNSLLLYELFVLLGLLFEALLKLLLKRLLLFKLLCLLLE